MHSLGHKAHFWDCCTSPNHWDGAATGTEPLGQALVELRALPSLPLWGPQCHPVPVQQEGGIILTVQDHPHGPAVGLALVGCQRHRARVPAGVEHVLGRGAEALKQGDVVAGSLPLILQ